jgi:hypothetical protein
MERISSCEASANFFHTILRRFIGDDTLHIHCSESNNVISKRIFDSTSLKIQDAVSLAFWVNDRVLFSMRK